MSWLLWIAVAVAMLVTWSVTVLGWVFAISSQGFPRNRIKGVPIIMGLSAIAGIALDLMGHSGWAAATVILIGPLLSFLFSAISI